MGVGGQRRRGSEDDPELFTSSKAFKSGSGRLLVLLPDFSSGIAKTDAIGEHSASVKCN